MRWSLVQVPGEHPVDDRLGPKGAQQDRQQARRQGGHEALEPQRAPEGLFMAGTEGRVAIQRLVPALPPRLLTVLLRALKPQPIVDRMFSWYLDQAPPDVQS